MTGQVYEAVTDLDQSPFHCAAASSVETGQSPSLVLCLVASWVEIGLSLMHPSLMAFFVEVTGQSLNRASSETSLSVVTDQANAFYLTMMNWVFFCQEMDLTGKFIGRG